MFSFSKEKFTSQYISTYFASKLTAYLLGQDEQSESCETCLMRPLYACYGGVYDENKSILAVFCSGQRGKRTYDDDENTSSIKKCVVD